MALDFLNLLFWSVKPLNLKVNLFLWLWKFLCCLSDNFCMFSVLFFCNSVRCTLPFLSSLCMCMYICLSFYLILGEISQLYLQPFYWFYFNYIYMYFKSTRILYCVLVVPFYIIILVGHGCRVCLTVWTY